MQIQPRAWAVPGGGVARKGFSEWVTVQVTPEGLQDNNNTTKYLVCAMLWSTSDA